MIQSEPGYLRPPSPLIAEHFSSLPLMSRHLPPRIYFTTPSRPERAVYQRNHPWVLHTNDPVNLGSGTEFWLQFAQMLSNSDKTTVVITLLLGFWENLLKGIFRLHTVSWADM